VCGLRVRKDERVEKKKPVRARRNRRPKAPLNISWADLVVLLIFVTLAAALSLLVGPAALPAVIGAAVGLYVAFRGNR
jgi:hypothetical protein